MSAPIEFRNYVRRMTMDDVNKGVQGARLPIGPVVNGNQPHAMFVSVGLQYRYQEKVFLNGAKAMKWSDWITVPLVKEDDAPPQQQGDAPPAV